MEKKLIKLKNVLERTSILLSKSEQSDWSPLTPEEVVQNLNAQISNIDKGVKVDTNSIAVEFAPTSTIQEISMSNNWSDEYLKLANEIDNLIDGILK